MSSPADALFAISSRLRASSLHLMRRGCASCSRGIPAAARQGAWDKLNAWWLEHGRPLLAVLMLLAVCTTPLLWSHQRVQTATLATGTAGHRLMAPFLYNDRGQPIAVSRAEAASPVRNPKSRARAAVVVLARDSDCEGVLLSMGRLEKRFNAQFKYPYVFLNNEAFGQSFINRTSAATSAKTLYGQIPQEHWSYPPFVDPARAAAAREDMRRKGVLYGNKESYHHMCRYYSGFFHFHPLLKDFDYYWRMEPDVHYYCDLSYDPFLYMQENGIKYGFVITIQELPKTIPTLWATMQRFVDAHKAAVPDANLMGFVRDGSDSYNLCHFWSNFELGDLNFFRSDAYTSYFNFIDRTGGFFYERWGDAPVHSLGAALFLNSTEVHFFQDIGYRHNSMKHCPAVRRNNCACDAIEAVRYHTPSFGVCHKRWDDFLAREEAARKHLA